MIFSQTKNTVLLKKKSILWVLPLAFLLLVSLPTFVSAQTTAGAAPPTTTSALSAQQQPATQDVVSCVGNGTQNAANNSCTRDNPDGTTTDCGGTLGGINNSCKIIYSDGSYTTVNANNAAGSQYVNYDPSGNVTGTQNTGVSNLAGTGTGTLSKPPATPTGGTCGITNIVGCGVSLLANIAYYLMSAAGYLLGLVGIVFNWVIVITVFQFSVYFGNSQGMLAAWGILRDVGNICILFGFIYLGITIILDINGEGARKALPRLLIFAALLNFSLFAGEAVVDVANVLSATLYKQAGNSTFGASNTTALSSTATTGATGATVYSTQVGIAGLIMQDTGTGGALAPKTQPTGDAAHLFAYVGTTVFILIVMAVLLAGSIIFFIRAVLLCLLLVISPLGFAAMAIPRFAAQGKQWQNMLIQNAFFAPMFLLLIFAGLKVMEAAHQSLDPSNTKSLADALAAPGSSIGGVLLVFGLTIGFMIAAFQFARSSSVIGGQFATNFAEKTVRGVARAPFLASRRVASVAIRNPISRNIVGSNAKKLNSWYDKQMAKGEAGKGGFGKTATGLLRASGADEAIQARGKKIANAKLGQKRTYEEEQKYKKDRTSVLTQTNARENNKKELDTLMGSNAGGVNDVAIERFLQKMSIEDIKQTDYIKKQSTGIDTIAKLLSTAKLDTLINDKEIGGAGKKLKDARFGQYNAWAGNYTNKDQVRALKNDELILWAKNDPSGFQDAATQFNDPANGGDGDSMLSADQRKFLAGNKEIPPTLAKIIADNNKGKRLGDLVTSGGNTAYINQIGKSMGKDDMEKVNNNVLTNPVFAASLDSEKLTAIMAKGNIRTKADKQQILDNLYTYYSGFAKGTPESDNYEDMKNYLAKNNRAQVWWGNTLP
jgi:hypothetical protein